MKQKNISHRLFFALIAALLACATAGAVFAITEAPDTAIKTPLLVPERSVSTFVPSACAPGQGLAINLIYPEKPRFKSGAPVAVVIPAGDGPDGLRFTAHTIQCGMCELRFAFPGGGKAGLQSSGIYDYRGNESQQALRDILLFAAGKATDIHGRSIQDLVPIPVATNNVGIVAWSNGGNIAIVTMAKFADKLQGIKWLCFYESSVGAMLYPPNLGGQRDLVINRHYREGSCATGDCLVDYRRLSYQPVGIREGDAHKQRGEPVLPGIVYFDDNLNKKWDEASEFAFSYCLDVGFDKQIYPPEVTAALLRKGCFVYFEEDTGPGGIKKDKDGKVLNPISDDLTAKQYKQLKSKRKLQHQEWVDQVEKELAQHPNPNIRVTDHKIVDVKTLKWPAHIANLEESEAYFKERDGSLYIEEVCTKFPNLLVTIFAGQIDHMQRQPDHPNVALLYNAFIADQAHWVRLNPDPFYVGQAGSMNMRNFVNNKPNAPIDSSAIDSLLEPEGLIPDYVYMGAAVGELADRVEKKNLTPSLEEVLVDYKYGAGPMPKMEQDN